MDQVMFIIYVDNQDRSKAFYRSILGFEPTLDVPGMTEFQLTDRSSLGIMPAAGIKRRLQSPDPAGESPDPTKGSGIPRCECYLLVDDPESYYERLLDAGGRGISPPTMRPWGDTVAYGSDPDGHIVAFAHRERTAP